MAEVWLRSNRRILALGLVPGLVISGASLSLLLSTVGPWIWWIALVAMAIGLLLIFVVAKQLLRPRVGYADGHVLFYLRAGAPIAVPVHVVEAFFLGQGPAYLPGTLEDKQEAINLVARLSQKEQQWQRLDVKPALGKWCEGYVSIRGTWCEPLSNDLIRRLNRRLSEVSRQVAESS